MSLNDTVYAFALKPLDVPNVKNALVETVLRHGVRHFIYMTSHQIVQSVMFVGIRAALSFCAEMQLAVIIIIIIVPVSVRPFVFPHIVRRFVMYLLPQSC